MFKPKLVGGIVAVLFALGASAWPVQSVSAAPGDVPCGPRLAIDKLPDELVKPVIILKDVVNSVCG